MKTLITICDLMRRAKISRSDINSRDRSPWRTGFELIAFALTWVSLLPMARAVDPSPAIAVGCPEPDHVYTLSYRETVLFDNPIMYWRLGESSGPFAYDETANHRDATYMGGPTLGLRGAIAGDTNTAAGFNGINQYVGWYPPVNYPVRPLGDAGNSFGGPGCSGAFTVEAWVKEKKVHPHQTVFNTRNGTADFSFDFKFDLVTVDALQKVIRIDIGDGKKLLSAMIVPFDVQPQVWYHVAAVVTKTGATLYVNGSSIAYASYNGVPLLFDSTHGVEIGADNRLREMFNGAIDEVAVYDHELSACQIVAHYLVGTQSAGGGE
jgi:hypothetical protein